ncbi:MAG: DUF4358 domain-containing protein [Oscillospiraceae bacterium]|jgi:hypothetical protein|nr:DUF4358 domain-containing protein [Oscillospiraceae bacterium]
MSPDEIAETIQANVQFAPLVQMNDDQIFTSFLNVDSGSVSSAALYVSSSEDKSDELVVVGLAHSKYFDEITAALLAHVNQRATNFKNQSSAESSKLTHAVLRRTKTVIILVVCEEYQKAEKVLDEIGAKSIKS